MKDMHLSTMKAKITLLLHTCYYLWTVNTTKMSYTYILVNKSAYLNDSALIIHHINTSNGWTQRLCFKLRSDWKYCLILIKLLSIHRKCLKYNNLRKTVSKLSRHHAFYPPWSHHFRSHQEAEGWETTDPKTGGLHPCLETNTLEWQWRVWWWNDDLF